MKTKLNKILSKLRTNELVFTEKLLTTKDGVKQLKYSFALAKTRIRSNQIKWLIETADSNK